ncbi:MULTISPECIES: FecR domain-containing protein [unclassified Herbaspirillum]|uniref:FecR family protein n=1 Tax=unclassified Herbaspirillum TaxID=2624150 RepID=UPI000E2FEA0E|nr:MULTISPECIES: FecR domain-containing protein [unclassified Herbaspirillum]RFB69741.1 iron dicitrate transport regulator FecR [Herbaspirillum sp. 3R-3a1]TFI07197.1 iron dicitrate transport regulator FecR [Herbaspirillum sp. 3R11]TFI13134.1 iron dicitrate transport regulator FecR [Herbaspirillum sp. 3R-11]TFI24220.1 iron dicitrate transport regulator FecR [Herbaspirillum sp. 3C11]
MSPRQSFEHALLLIARQYGGSAATAQSAREELALWREQSEEHEATYQLALDAWAASDLQGLRDRVPQPQAGRPNAGRRALLSVLGAVGIAALTGAGGRWWWLQPTEQAALSTDRAQTLARRMGDGSQLDLGALTRAQVTYFRNRREVRLTQGEIRLQVSPDAARPFTVSTSWGQVQVRGTVFTVAVRDNGMSVEVAEGHVAVWASRGNTLAPESERRPPDMELRAGDAVLADRNGIGARRSIPVASVGAWKDGWLVFDGASLSDAVSRWNDYLYQPLALADDARLRELRLTGSFQLRDPNAFLSVLPRILPVRISRNTDGAAMIVPR